MIASQKKNCTWFNPNDLYVDFKFAWPYFLKNVWAGKLNHTSKQTIIIVNLGVFSFLCLQWHMTNLFQKQPDFWKQSIFFFGVAKWDFQIFP